MLLSNFPLLIAALARPVGFLHLGIGITPQRKPLLSQSHDGISLVAERDAGRPDLAVGLLEDELRRLGFQFQFAQ
jgi:hypothetical protein